MGLKFIETLVKNKFSMSVTDKDGQTPLAFLINASVGEDAILPIIKIMARHSFYGLVLGEASGQTTGLVMDLFKTGKITIRMFKILEPQLRKLSLSALKNFHCEVYALNTTVTKAPEKVMSALDAILCA